MVTRPRGAAPLTSDDSGGATQRIANRPVVAHALDALRAAGADELAIVGSPCALNEIRTSLLGLPPGSVSYVPGPEDGDFLALLAACAPFVGDAPCLVHAANGVVEQPVARLTELVVGDTPDLALFLHHGCPNSQRFSAEVERLLGIADLHRGRNGLGIAGFGLLGPGAMRYATDNGGPHPVECDLTAVAERIATAGGRLQIGRVKSWRQYMGHPHDLLEMNRIVLDAIEGMTDPVEGEDNRIEGRVEIDPTAEIIGSTISGPVIIGEHARVTDAYIGPYTAIGAGAEVSGSEVERSIVGERARIRHVGVRVQASTVGPDAQIFRDFGLPRAMRMHVGAGVEVALE